MRESSENQEPKLLQAYSEAERHFYLMVRRCKRCGSGPFELVGRGEDPQLGDQIDAWQVRCRRCGAEEQIHFDRRALLVEPSGQSESLPVVNPSDQPSKLLDLAQWLALFHSIIESASKTQDKAESRRLGYEAALCLEEALKFYQPDSDLPPARAFFSEDTLASFRQHPEQFTHQKLLQIREKLPALARMQKVLQQRTASERRSLWGWVKGKLKSRQ